MKRAYYRRCILGRLLKGPASNRQLAQIGGLRFGARLFELRSAGHKITTHQNHETGLVVYTLEAK